MFHSEPQQIGQIIVQRWIFPPRKSSPLVFVKGISSGCKPRRSNPSHRARAGAHIHSKRRETSFFFSWKITPRWALQSIRRRSVKCCDRCTPSTICTGLLNRAEKIDGGLNGYLEGVSGTQIGLRFAFNYRPFRFRNWLGYPFFLRDLPLPPRDPPRTNRAEKSIFIKKYSRLNRI